MSFSHLYDGNKLKSHLDRAGLRLNKSSGQHFLVDRSVLRDIADCLGGEEKVVEIGAGIGSLTRELAENHSKVWAVEIDGRFREEFESNLSSREGVEFVEENFLNLSPRKLELSPDGSAEFAGNLPYNISIPILKKLSRNRSFYARGVLTLQKEVGDRIVANPGGKEIGPLTYYVRAFFGIRKVRDVSPESFYPPPKVVSSVLEMEPYPEPKIRSEPKNVFPLIRGVYNYRRKTLRKGLKLAKEIELEKSEIREVLENADIDPMSRPENLSLEDFDRLADSILSLKERS